MKLEYIGCCFRFEFELFRSDLDLRKYPVGPLSLESTLQRARPRDPTFVTQRKLLRGIAAQLKPQAGAAGPNPSETP